MSASIRTLLVDDEPPARERLAALLAAHPRIEIVGEAGDIATAREVYAREKPDLLFLDVQLPRASGFDLIPMLDGFPAVIFVTAYDQFALRAFEVNAIDYLLKPIHPDRLALALTRVKIPPAPPGKPSGADHVIALQEDRALRLVPETSVTHIEAQGNYTLVHLMDGPSALIRRSLADWEKQLPKNTFLRIDRSFLVRLDAVRSIKAESRDLTLLTFAGSAESIPVGRRAGLLVRRALGK